MARRIGRGKIVFFTAFFCMTCRVLFAYTTIEDVFNKSDVRITLDLQDVSLRNVLKMLSVQSGLNFVSSEAVADRKLTLFLDNVSLRDALDKIFNVNNLTYEMDEETNIFTVRDWGKPSLALETKVYNLKYLPVTNSKLKISSTGLKDALSKVVSEYGKITEDPSTNSLIITDMPSKFPEVEQIIKQLDVEIPQVLIEVEILDVDKSDVDTLGFKFSGTNWLTLAGPNFGQTYFPFNSDFFRKAAAKTAPTTGTLNMTGWTVALDFLRTRATTRFLARPKLFVLNNETAELKLTTNEGINSVTTIQSSTGATNQTTNVERAETGVSLKVTPQISISTGEITMMVEPSVKEAVTGLTVGTQSTKDVEERSIKSIVRVKDGDTIIVGGLIRQKDPLTYTKVPFFSDIPVLGMLFRHKNSGPRKDREILAFLTTKIISNSREFSEGQIKAPEIGSEREQEQSYSMRRSEVVSRALGVYETQ